MRLRTPFARVMTSRAVALRSTDRRTQALLGTALVVGALAVLNVVMDALPSSSVSFSVAAAVALLAFARLSGLSWEQLGLSRDRMRSGGVWALAAVLTVAAVYVAGLLFPVTRGAFLDSRYNLGVSEAVLTAFVLIPLKTVLFEEVAFRSVLWGMLRRHTNKWGALAISSALFGLWHVLPSLSFASSNHGVNALFPGDEAAATVYIVLGTVAFTALGGVVAGELRRRSGSVLASAGMHWATNALGVLFALIAWRIAGS